MFGKHSSLGTVFGKHSSVSSPGPSTKAERAQCLRAELTVIQLDGLPLEKVYTCSKAHNCIIILFFQSMNTLR